MRGVLHGESDGIGLRRDESAGIGLKAAMYGVPSRGPRDGKPP